MLSHVDSSQPHGQQHARIPCPSPTLGACSNACPSSVMSSKYIILCCPLLLLLSVFPSIKVFSNESILHIRWPNYWVFSYSMSPFNEYSGLVSFGIFWLSPCCPGTLKSLLQCHSSKASILWHSTFFMVQISHTNMITGKTIALTRQMFVGKITSLLFNMLSRLVIAFLPENRHLLIAWLKSTSAVILEPKRITSVTVSIVSPSTCQEVMKPDTMILVFLMLSY